MSIYLTSSVDQAGLNKAVNFLFKTINEEICKLYQTTGKIEPDKIFVGGNSQGSLLTAAALIRSNEYLKSPLGGAFGFIGAVPTLF